MSELLDIVDEDGEPTGVTVDREVAHRDGIRHRTSHVWLVRKGPTNALEVLLQKRAADKDAFPEIETVRWMDIGECIRAVENKTIPNCISVDELAWVRSGVLAGACGDGAPPRARRRRRDAPPQPTLFGAPQPRRSIFVTDSDIPSARSLRSRAGGL